MSDMLERQLTAQKVLLKITRAGHRTTIDDDILIRSIEKRLGDDPDLADLDEVATKFVSDNSPLFTKASTLSDADDEPSGHPDPSKQTLEERRAYLEKQGMYY